MTRTGVLRAAVIGGLLAVVVAVGLFAFVAGGFSLLRKDTPERVVFVVESTDSRGLPGARLIGVVSERRLHDVDPDTKVLVSGTSGSTLADAYTYGGGEAVASELATSNGAGLVGFVVVPQDVWVRAVMEGPGLTVDLPGPVNVFTGADLYSFRAGRQSLTASEAVAALAALPYYPEGQRGMLRVALIRGIAASVGRSEGAAAGLQSSMSPEVLGAWLTTQLSASATLRD
jgi:hypothetical protein